MICEASPIKAEYKIGLVDDVHPVTVVCALVQKNPHGEYTSQRIQVKRSVQRLSLILPVEEQVSQTSLSTRS